MLNEVLLKYKTILGLRHTCYSVFGNWDKSRKKPNKGHGYTEIHP